MNSFSLGGSAARICSLCIAVASLLLFASNSPALGQERSQDRDNPTLIEGKGITDKLDGSGDEYFYQFIMGQGKLSILFKVTASGTNAGATLDLFDANSSTPILSNVLVQGADGGSDQALKSVELAGRRNIILMRIKGIRYGDSGGTGTYIVAIVGNAAPPEDKKATEPSPSRRFDGELDGTDSSQSHVFSVKGPGKVKLTFDVKASETNAGANFELLDSNGRTIMSDVLVQGVDSGSERISRTVSFAKDQVVTIKVKGIKYGSSGGRGIYSVQLSGALGK